MKGYIATSSVLIIMVVVLSLTATVSLLSIGAGQGSLAHTTGEQTLFLAESCVEQALLNIKNTSGYTFSGTYSFPPDSCNVTVTYSAPTYTITSTATIGDYTKTISATATRTTSVLLTSWLEI